MSKKIKQLIALLLSAMMLLSLAACGDGSGKVSGKDTEAGSYRDNLSEDMLEIDDFFADYEAFDMGGRVIKIAVFYDMYYDSFDTKPEDNPGLQDKERGQLMLDNVKRIEQKYNCKIEYVNPGGDAIKSSLNTSVVNGTPDYDVYLTQMDWALPLAVNGYFVDLTTFKADYLDLNNNQDILDVVEIAGTNCFFAKSGVDLSTSYLAYNSEMIQEAGLEDPNELYARGEWTWEKFAEYCTKLTKDTDNNGETDIYGYGGDLTWTIQEFLASNNAILVNADGTEGLTDPKVLKTFEYLGELYAEKKVARPVVDDWYEGIAGWINKQSVFGVTKMWILQTMAPKFEHRIVPFPVGPDGTGETAGQGFNDYFAIPRGVEDPEKVYQIMEEFFGFYCDDLDVRDEDMLMLAMGCFTNMDDVNTAVEMGTWGNGDVWTIVDSEYLINSIYSGVVNGDHTPAEGVESVKQLFQDEINAIFNQ